MITSNNSQVLVVGGGTFGTCLAQHLAEKGSFVTIYSNSNEVVQCINDNHRNPKYLSHVILSQRVSATEQVTSELAENISVVVMAVPTQFMRGELKKIAPVLSKCLDQGRLFVCAAKGIEIESRKLPGDVIRDLFGDKIADDAVFLSGPSFASEIAEREPTCVTVASKNHFQCSKAQEIFHAAHFRVYTCSDPIGLEVAGALKNVIAIAAGACAGLGFAMNSRAAFITRGLAEITRIGVAMGADPLTFNGLAGVGDLFLSCTSEKSRNFTVGFRLGKGEQLEQILSSLGTVAEGVATTKAAYQLGRDLNVSIPITEEVYKVLYQGKAMTKAVVDLLTRDAKPELDIKR